MEIANFAWQLGDHDYGNHQIDTENDGKRLLLLAVSFPLLLAKSPKAHMPYAHISRVWVFSHSRTVHSICATKPWMPPSVTLTSRHDSYGARALAPLRVDGWRLLWPLGLLHRLSTPWRLGKPMVSDIVRSVSPGFPGLGESQGSDPGKTETCSYPMKFTGSCHQAPVLWKRVAWDASRRFLHPRKGWIHHGLGFMGTQWAMLSMGQGHQCTTWLLIWLICEIETCRNCFVPKFGFAAQL